jgi:hypothetical protein
MSLGVISKRLKRFQILSVMVMACSIGLTGHIMKASGVIIKLKVRAHFGTRRAIFIGGSSKTIWLMATESTLTSMGRGIRESSKKMFKRVMARKNG